MGRLGKPQKSRKHKKVRSLDPFGEDETGANFRNVGKNQRPKSLEQEMPKKALRLFSSIKGQGLHQNQGVKKKKKNKFEAKRIPFGQDRQADSKSHREIAQEEIMGSADLIERFKLDRTGDIDGTKSKRSQKTKRRLKEHKKKDKEKREEKDKERERDFNQFKDEVKFGDIVHAPPTLSAVPRKAQAHTGVPRPGKKSLLLKEIMTTNSSHGQEVNDGRQLGQSVKKKNLSLAKQHALDQERTRAIDIYRKMKNKKMKAFS